MTLWCVLQMNHRSTTAKRSAEAHTEYIKEEVNEIGFFNMSNSSAAPHDERRGVQRSNNKKTERGEKKTKKKTIATPASYPTLSTHPNQFSVSQFISHLNGSPRTRRVITLLVGSLWCERWKLLSVLTERIHAPIRWIEM